MPQAIHIPTVNTLKGILLPGLFPCLIHRVLFHHFIVIGFYLLLIVYLINWKEHLFLQSALMLLK